MVVKLMLNIVNNSTNPYFNLALEEYFLKNDQIADDLVIIWQNSPAVIVGKHQNTVAEINAEFIKQQGIYVVRRSSGGGAVYHDLGNINFTFIMHNQPSRRNDFSYFAGSIVDALRAVGIQAEFTGRNDITIDGKKFSGNAQYFYQDKVLHHGTILFDSDLTVVQQALSVKTDTYTSKAVKSTPSRVTNIRPYLNEPITIEKFKQILVESIFAKHQQPYQEHQLTPAELNAINELVAKRYQTWDWNYGASPQYNFHQDKKFTGGTISLYLDIKQGRIEQIKIHGDFFANGDIHDLEQLLTGQKYEQAQLAAALADVDITKYLHNITADEFLSCFF
jgi:lipoate-protein ligase A